MTVIWSHGGLGESYSHSAEIQIYLMIFLKFIPILKNCLNWQEPVPLRTNYSGVGLDHRIKDDRMENSLNGRRIWHCAFAASVYKVQRLRQY